MSGPRQPRNVQGPAPPPASNAFQAQLLQQVTDTFKAKFDGLSTTFREAIDQNNRRFTRQEAETAKMKSEMTGKYEKVVGELEELTEKYEKVAGELEELKKAKVEVLEGKMAGNRGADGNDGDDDNDVGGRWNAGSDGNWGGSDYDMDLGDGHNYDDGSQDYGDNTGVDNDTDQGAGNIEESGESRGSTPSGEAETHDAVNHEQLSSRGSEQVEVDTGADNNSGQGIERAEGSGGSQSSRGSTPVPDGLRQQHPESPVRRDAMIPVTSGQQQAAIQTQKTFTLENLQKLLETGNTSGVLDAIQEKLAQLTSLKTEQSETTEIVEVFANLEIMEQKRIQQNMPVKEAMMDGKLFDTTKLHPDVIAFYARSFEQLFVIIMKRNKTITDLKTILETKTGKKAETLRCFVGTRLLLECYDIRQSAITDHCLVHVLEGNPNISTSF